MAGECTSTVNILIDPIHRVIQNQLKTYRTNITLITTLEIKLQ